MKDSVKRALHGSRQAVAVSYTHLDVYKRQVFFAAGLRDANIIIIYILGVLVTAIWTHGHVYGAIGSLLSVVAFTFFFTVPRFTLEAAAPDYPVTFLIMLIASVISSTLATRVKKQARQSAQKAYYTELLMSSSQKLQQGKNEQEIIQLAAEQVSILLERPVLYALAKGKGELQFQVTPAERREELLKSMTCLLYTSPFSTPITHSSVRWQSSKENLDSSPSLMTTASIPWSGTAIPSMEADT